MSKPMMDYLTVIVDADAKWVTDCFAKNRRLAFYGVQVAITQEGKKLTLDPVIPCAGPLADLVQKYPKASRFKFDRKKRKWKVV
jgi:hypothetical protein